jgi:hypothetical protein
MLNITNSMSNNVLQMLTTGALPFPRTELRGAPVKLLLREPAGAADVGAVADEPHSTGRRTRLWEFGISLHCSIIGTCLSTGELRQILVKLRIDGVATASDHDLHNFGVMFASRRTDGAKFIQKALDRRHRVAVARYAKAKDADALLALWQESLKDGDIPGAYWAVLTHPAATEETIKRVYGDVHMLSHLVGAANRADIRRLHQLEQDNAMLAAKVERQQRQLHEGFVTRDRTIARLQALLADGADSRSATAGRNGDGADETIRDLNSRLSRLTSRLERNERSRIALTETLDKKESALRVIEQRHEQVRSELNAVEEHLARLVPSESEPAAAIDLSGFAILYVGGRANQIPQLRALIERAGGIFLHHDGGIEHNPGLLPGHIARATHVFFPVDCVSHDGAASVKRICRQAGKAFEPLRTASLTCLFAAVAALSRGNRIAAE